MLRSLADTSIDPQLGLWNSAQIPSLLQLIARPDTSEMVFYNLWYHFWGQYRCWTKKSIGSDFCVLFKFALPSTS